VRSLSTGPMLKIRRQPDSGGISDETPHRSEITVALADNRWKRRRSEVRPDIPVSTAAIMLTRQAARYAVASSADGGFLDNCAQPSRSPTCKREFGGLTL